MSGPTRPRPALEAVPARQRAIRDPGRFQEDKATQPHKEQIANVSLRFSSTLTTSRHMQPGRQTDRQSPRRCRAWRAMRLSRSGAQARPAACVVRQRVRQGPRAVRRRRPVARPRGSSRRERNSVRHPSHPHPSAPHPFCFLSKRERHEWAVTFPS